MTGAVYFLTPHSKNDATLNLRREAEANVEC